MTKQAPQPGPGPQPQWSTDGRWWWDGSRWNEMWQPPRGLAWDGQSWSRAVEGGEAAPEPEPAPEPVLLSQPRTPARGNGNGARSRASRPPVRTAANGHAKPAVLAQAAHPPEVTLPVRARAVAAAPAPRPAPRRVHRSRRHTLLLVTSAVVLMLVGITTDLVASNLGKGPSYPTSPRSQLSSSQLARALVGRQFTRDVIPPDLATAPPLSDVFIADQVPGLVGESTTTTTDQGSTVTFYVFSDPIWAQAFMANPPIAYGCGVCTSMKGASAVDGVGDRATSYVLYRKSAAGESWIATTTYAARGAVVINAWFMPVNVGTPAPSSTDLYVPTADAKAAVALLQRISAG